MRGQILLIAIVAVASAAFFWKSFLSLQPLRPFGSVKRSTVIVEARDESLPVGGRLVEALNRFEREPTSEFASRAWDAFSNVDARLGTLKGIVSDTVGGMRADAEVERIELQRLRDAQLARFAVAQRRAQAAYVALDALASSIESGEGLQDAASILVHGRQRGVADVGKAPAFGVSGWRTEWSN